jgi:hypothetical protein
MSTTSTLAPAPGARTATGAARPDDVPGAGAVGLVVDDSVAAIAAARWAARLAGEKRTALVVVLVLPAAGSAQDADTVLARVRPTLDRSGRPWTVRTCRTSPDATGLRARRRARRVRDLVPDDVSVLVVPGSRDLRHGLAGRLASLGDLDLLVVPDRTPGATDQDGPTSGDGSGGTGGATT